MKLFLNDGDVATWVESDRIFDLCQGSLDWVLLLEDADAVEDLSIAHDHQITLGEFLLDPSLHGEEGVLLGLLICHADH